MAQNWHSAADDKGIRTCYNTTIPNWDSGKRTAVFEAGKASEAAFFIAQIKALLENGERTCRRVFFVVILPISLEIHKVFLREIVFMPTKNPSTTVTLPIFKQGPSNEELLCMIRGCNILRLKKLDYTRHPMAKQIVKTSIMDYTPEKLPAREYTPPPPVEARASERPVRKTMYSSAKPPTEF